LKIDRVIATKLRLKAVKIIKINNIEYTSTALTNIFDKKPLFKVTYRLNGMSCLKCVYTFQTLK